ncbi:MAG TPA: nitronate monooxygenase family protein [Acidimicrobiia bacterium]|jgi:NAD(P)H-dependent flavin oxidoreductase YrpB (nitropropane dioxygenase family)|nr:nitronate monooxygenase family protein [Acidimicrobiia bacterium]
MKTRASEMFGIDLPIFAFSHCRDVVAAVSKAGGLGVLGALAFSPEQLEIELNWIDEHVDGKPYGVDVVMPAKYAGAGELDPERMGEQLKEMIPQQHRDWVNQLLAEHDVPELSEEDRSEGLLGWVHEKGREQVQIALEHPIKLLANALGSPPKDVVDLAHEHGVKVAALCGSVQQAERHVNQGVDIVVAQGGEAGGHTGDVASLVLWPDVVDAVAPAPVLAAGGIGTGRQIAAALALGCEGVWTGSIWLTTAESDTGSMAMEKLLAAGARDTVRSRSWTGKPARMLRTEWTEAWEREDSPGTLPMPLQFMLINDAMRRINKFNVKELTTMPVGQIVGRMNTVRPVRDVMFDLVDEFVESSQKLEKLVEE